MIMTGNIVKGRGAGKAIGFPTINVLVSGQPNHTLQYGVYGCKVQTTQGCFRGAMHFGPRRTFNLNDPSLEIFLLDFTGDLYGTEVKIEVFDKIRDIVAFESPAALKRQIELDVAKVRAAVIM
jgi:riboflavin kinase/FMN adenylyltransferase